MDVLLGGTQADSVLSSKGKLLGFNLEVLGTKLVSFSQCAQICPVFIADRINRATDFTLTHLQLPNTLGFQFFYGAIYIVDVQRKSVGNV